MAKTADQARMEASKAKPAKIKVPQSVIDDIKKMGMTKALAGAKNANPVMAEALTRMYGARRVAAAKGKVVAATSADAARAGATKAATKAAIKAVSTKGTTKVAPKKDNTKSNILKATAGTVAAVGLLAASKGKAAGAVAKLSPALGGLSKSAVGKAIFGKGEVLTNKALSASGRVAAKAGKSVTQSQYDAMTAAAKAAGKTAAKTTTKAAAKAPAKSADAARAMASVPKKKLAVAGTGVGSVTLKGDKGKKK